MTTSQASAVRKSAGMTLVETTCALGILAVGVLAMMAAQVTALQQNNRGRHTTEAAQIARDQMEFIQRLPWTHASVAPSAGWQLPRIVTQTVQRASGQTGYAEESFTTDWRVQPGANPNLRRVEVRVQWTEDASGGGTAGNRSIVMSTLKANY